MAGARALSRNQALDALQESGISNVKLGVWQVMGIQARDNGRDKGNASQ